MLFTQSILHSRVFSHLPKVVGRHPGFVGRRPGFVGRRTSFFYFR
jgi:hypothetical protein